MPVEHTQTNPGLEVEDYNGGSSGYSASSQSGTVERKPLTERIQDFDDTLSQVTEVRPDSNLVLNFDLPNPTEYAMDYFRQQEFIDSPHAPHRLYVNGGAIGSLSIAQSTKIERVGFEPRKFRTGKFSAHGVFFGDLQVVTKDGAEGEVSVAVKPHEDEAGEANDTCLMDYVNTLAIAGLNVYTLRPVGIINGLERAYSLTALQEGLTTLDSIDWNSFYPNTDNNPGMVNIWSQVARQAAMLHSLGNIMHGDLAARNIATTVDDTVFFLDWEMANISTEKTHGSTSSWGFAHADLDRLIHSMCTLPDPNYGGGIGIFTEKEGDWWMTFKNIFFDEYCSYRMAFAETNHTEAETQKEMEDLEKSLKDLLDYFRYAE